MRRIIAFVINSLEGGGAERVLATILANIGQRRVHYDVHVILLDDNPEMRAIPAYITKHVLDSGGRFMRSIRLLDRCLANLNPALVVSFLGRANIATGVTARRLGLPHIICERTHLSSHLNARYRGPKLRVAQWAPRLAYRSAAVVLGVSNGVTEDLVKHFGVHQSRARTIYNPYDLEAIRHEALQSPEMDLPGKFIIAVGRLDPGKNFAQLIDAYIRSEVPAALVILGEGPERSALERLVTAHRAGDRILLPGYARNPFAIVARADFFVSASLYEGFPNAMVEAMALGRPVVVSDCRSGPAEILAGVVKVGEPTLVETDYGILVPVGSVEELAKGILRMVNPEVHRRFALKAQERAQSFRAAFICDQYWALFDEVANKLPPERAKA